VTLGNSQTRSAESALGNYTTWLNIAFLILAALLTWRFFRTGGRQMLTMMGGAPSGDGAAEPPAPDGDHHHHSSPAIDSHSPPGG